MSAQGPRLTPRDPMNDYYEWVRKYRRRQRLQNAATIILLTAAAWAVLLLVGFALVFAIVTFG